jgi:hypothetical protein
MPTYNRSTGLKIRNTNAIRPADEGCVEVQSEGPYRLHRIAPTKIDRTKLANARAGVDAVALACGWN